MSFFGISLGRQSTDFVYKLKYVLETMPGSRKYNFTPAARAEVLAALYKSFWASYPHMFTRSDLQSGSLLSEHQASSGMSHENEDIVPGRACGRILKKGDTCYRCRDCALDDSCVLCSFCFHASDHAGHSVSFYLTQQTGGCCDCGDPEAWRHPIHCRFHPPAIPQSSSPTVLGRAMEVNSWLSKHSRSHTSVPQDLRDSMSRTVAYALDFVLDTLDFSPEDAQYPRTEADLRRQPTADPIPNDVHAVILWNDDKHSYDEIVQHLKSTIDASEEQATASAQQLEVEGRDVVLLSSDVATVLHVSSVIAQIDMNVTLRRAYDTFREQVAAVIIEWLLDLTTCKLGSDGTIIREIIAAELYSPRMKDSSSLTSNPEATRIYADIKDSARLDWLFLYHTRLWRRPRLNIKQIYVSMLSISHEHKLTVALHFASVYHRLVDAYLLIDRESEASVKYFSVQLFTVPSVASYIVKTNGIINRILCIIEAFFTNQIAGKRITYPPKSDIPIDPDSNPFKSKRFIPVFSDLRYLISNDTTQELMVHNNEYITQFAKVCQLFMGINPNKRAATTHVEYETEAWISVFNVTLSLSRVVKAYGEAYAKASVAELALAITTVMHHILLVCTLADNQLDKTKYRPITFHQVHFNISTFEVIDFDVMEGWVSFHHSLHWLLAELFKHVHLLSENPLRAIGSRSLADIVLRHASERAVLTVLDFPLRVLAMVAQIRTGLWVRNGFPIRGQLLHYRDYMLRELCYDQDLLILQTCLVVLDPNVVLVSALDRFQLLRWFSGDTNPSAYDEAQSYSMAEEFLYVIITSVSEFGTAKGLTMDELVRREIVHGLALGPCSYTELCKRVPERVTEEASFDRVLGSISTFKAPESISDSGTYSLKDEVFDEVNPFFFHYTRNRREEIEGILKLRLQKKTGVENPVVTPRPLGVSSGPFATLSLVFHSEVLLQILFYALWNVYTEVELHKNMPSGGDAILDQTLHLLMLAIVEHPQSFPRFAAVIRLRDGAPKSIIRTLCMMETHDKLKSFKPKVAWILDHMAEQIPSEILQWRISGVSNAKAAQSDDAKKRAAKARQDAIMKQFAVAQKTFLDTFEADDIDDDGMDATTEQENVSLGVCIVCQENLDQSRAFGALALLQPSRFIRQTPDGRADYASDILLSPVSLDRQLPPPHLGPQAAPSFHGFPHDHTRFGVHSSLCGHLMHLDCFSVYMHSVEQRHVQQTSRNHPESVERSEFICPLCKSLGNVILPVPEEPRLRVPPPSHLGDWMRSVGIELLRSTPDRMVESLQYSSGSGQFVFWGAEDSGYSPYDGQAHIDDSHRMVERLRSVVYATSSQSRHRRDRPEPDSPQRGAGMYLPDDIVAYTVSSIEIAQRGNGAPGTSVINGLSDQSLRLLRGLLACLGKLAALQFPERRDSGSESMRQAILKRVLPEWTRDAGLRKPLLLRDPLGILAEAACVAPDILPQLTVLMYYACLARTAIALVNYMAHLRPTSALPVIPERDHPKIFGDVRTFVLSVARHSRTLEQTAEQTLRSPLSEARLEKLLYSHTLPFLRQAAILRQAVSPLSPSSMSDDSCEYVRLLNVLDIPFPSELAKHESLQNVLAGWSSHYGLLHVLSPLESIISMDYPNVYQLVQLPYALDSFFTDDAPLKCQRCETIPQDPAICMICGTICCSQSHCCTDGDHREEGECNMHTRECGGAIGLYFQLKRCSMLYLYAGKGAFGNPPYLDVHGETDVLMRRGRLQFLHAQRLEDLRKTWLNHGIPTFVARKLDGTIDPGGWETM